VTFITERKSRYLEPPPRPPVAHAALPPSDFLRPAIPLVAGGLALIALVASWQSTPAAPNWVTREPTQQDMTAATQTVNVATKGSRLELAAPVVARTEAEPAKVRVASLTPDAISKDSEPDYPAVKGKATYGLASYYWQGRKTASGERFNADALTAAHRTLPFGTRVRVTSLVTGRSVTVRINDRGPFIRGRTVDISRAAAQSLGMIDRGVTKVKLDVLR
jgi:rare lipoprotein A